MKLATTSHFEHVGVARVGDAQGDVLQQFLLEALANLAAGDVLAFAAGQRRGVDHEVHGQRGLVDRDRLHAFETLGVAQGDADVDLRNAGHQHDVARFGELGGFALQSFEGEYLADLALAAVLIAIHDDQFLVGANAATLDAADAELAHVGRVVERAHLHLQRPVGIDLGGGTYFRMASNSGRMSLRSSSRLSTAKPLRPEA